MRLHNESHIIQIQGNSFHGFQQFLVNAEFETAFFKHAVFSVWLVQSQCQTRSASATGGKIYADRTLFFIRKVRFELFAGIFFQFNHDEASSLLLLIAKVLCALCQRSGGKALSQCCDP